MIDITTYRLRIGLFSGGKSQCPTSPCKCNCNRVINKPDEDAFTASASYNSLCKYMSSEGTNLSSDSLNNIKVWFYHYCFSSVCIITLTKFISIVFITLSISDHFSIVTKGWQWYCDNYQGVSAINSARKITQGKSRAASHKLKLVNWKK